jgi:tetratricopeptide (TPR) repeat protein
VVTVIAGDALFTSSSYAPCIHKNELGSAGTTIRNVVNHARLVALIVSLALGSALCVDAIAQTASPPDAATTHFANGYNQLKAGDADSAVDEFKAGLKLKPDNAMAWFYLGEARLQLGSTDLAKAAYQKSLDLDPKSQQSNLARKRLNNLNSTVTTVGQGATAATPIPATIGEQSAAGTAGAIAGVHTQSAVATSSTQPVHLSAQLLMLHDVAGPDLVVPWAKKDGTYYDNVRYTLQVMASGPLLADLKQHFDKATEAQFPPGVRAAPDVTFVVDVTKSHIETAGWTASVGAVHFTAELSAVSAAGGKVSKTFDQAGPRVNMNTGASLWEGPTDIKARGEKLLERSFRSTLEQAFSSFLDLPDVVAFVSTLRPGSELASAGAPAAGTTATQSPKRVAPTAPIEALSAEDQAHYQEVLKSGKPSQMYLLAVKLYGQNRNELADKLCQAIVDRYPDDPYAAKAIDRLDAAQQGAQKVAQQQQMMGQQQAMQEQQMAQQQEAGQKRANACHIQCSAQRTSCDSRVSAQTSQGMAGALTGLLTHSTGQMLGSIAGSNSGEDCSSEWTACDAGCL